MYVISHALSEKCKIRSTKVNEQGDETLKEKTGTKNEIDRLISQNRVEREHQEQIVNFSTSEVDKKENKVEITINDEKKVFENKKELAK